MAQPGRKTWPLVAAAIALTLGLGLLALALPRHASTPGAVVSLRPSAPRAPAPDAIANLEAALPDVLGPPPPLSPQSAAPPPPPAPAKTVAAIVAPPRPHVSLPPPRLSPRLSGEMLIAICIDDMGLDRRHSSEAIGLPGPLTLSFMTYAEDLGAQTAAGRAQGHEIMLHVPMEPQGGNYDPGPNVLKLSLDDDEIRRRLDWGLQRIAGDGVVGINNHMGSRFTESPERMALVIAMLRERGLFFLDSRTTPRTVGAEIARDQGVPHAQRDVFLDAVMSASAVSAELARTESVARQKGMAIAIGHPHPVTLDALRHWLPGLAAKGFRLVPVSAIVQRNEQAEGRAVKPAG